MRLHESQYFVVGTRFDVRFHEHNENSLATNNNIDYTVCMLLHVDNESTDLSERCNYPLVNVTA